MLECWNKRLLKALKESRWCQGLKVVRGCGKVEKVEWIVEVLVTPRSRLFTAQNPLCRLEMKTSMAGTTQLLLRPQAHKDDIPPRSSRHLSTQVQQAGMMTQTLPGLPV